MTRHRQRAFIRLCLQIHLSALFSHVPLHSFRFMYLSQRKGLDWQFTFLFSAVKKMKFIPKFIPKIANEIKSECMFLPKAFTRLTAGDIRRCETDRPVKISDSSVVFFFIFHFFSVSWETKGKRREAEIRKWPQGLPRLGNWELRMAP